MHLFFEQASDLRIPPTQPYTTAQPAALFRETFCSTQPPRNKGRIFYFQTACLEKAV